MEPPPRGAVEARTSAPPPPAGKADPKTDQTASTMPLGYHAATPAPDTETETFDTFDDEGEGETEGAPQVTGGVPQADPAGAAKPVSTDDAAAELDKKVPASPTLNHMTLGRPKGPADRRLPGSTSPGTQRNTAANAADAGQGTTPQAQDQAQARAQATPMEATEPSNDSEAATQDPASQDPVLRRLALSKEDLVVYRRLWASVQTDGLIGAKAAVGFLQSSGLLSLKLRKVWTLADSAKPKGSLTEDEFFTALKLVAVAQQSGAVSLDGLATPCPLPKVTGVDAAPVAKADAGAKDTATDAPAPTADQATTAKLAVPGNRGVAVPAFAAVSAKLALTEDQYGTYCTLWVRARLRPPHSPKAVPYHEQSHYRRCMIGHSLGRMDISYCLTPFLFICSCLASHVCSSIRMP